AVPGRALWAEPANSAARSDAEQVEPGTPHVGVISATVPPGTAPLVVIDPGHGGGNAGAPGAEHGYFEKQLTLPLGRGLAERLRQRGYRVALTRDSDIYLTLRQRVSWANQVGADLFISIHANATESHNRRGYETFVLSPRAIDVDGRALRANDGVDDRDADPRIARVLDDVERGAAQSAAADLAHRIQGELQAVRGPEGNRGVRQDSMHVLLGATMPAVLVEVGFIDHPVEYGELRDPEVQDQLCDALAAAVSDSLPFEVSDSRSMAGPRVANARNSG
ncbi:MAG: N-acetylmuramoyl-L-alanine amidase, partial [Myxococcota bacterium]